MPRRARMMFRGYLVGDSDQIKKGVRIPVQVYLQGGYWVTLGGTKYGCIGGKKYDCIDGKGKDDQLYKLELGCLRRIPGYRAWIDGEHKQVSENAIRI